MDKLLNLATSTFLSHWTSLISLKLDAIKKCGMLLGARKECKLLVADMTNVLEFYSETLRVLECALCNDHPCIPLLLCNKNNTTEKLMCFKSVLSPFMDTNQYGVAKM